MPHPPINPNPSLRLVSYNPSYCSLLTKRQLCQLLAFYPVAPRLRNISLFNSEYDTVYGNCAEILPLLPTKDIKKSVKCRFSYPSNRRFASLEKTRCHTNITITVRGSGFLSLGVINHSASALLRLPLRRLMIRCQIINHMNPLHPSLRSEDSTERKKN